MSTQPRRPAGQSTGGQFTWPAASTETVATNDWRHYDAAILPSIAGLSVAEALPADLIADVGAAQQAIRDFDSEMSRELAGLALGSIDTILVRSEAASSSQIEHLTVSAKQLALAEIGESKRANAKLVNANTAALRDALRIDNPFSTAAITAMQAELLGDTDLHIGPRHEPVWIGTNGSTPVGADYVAPQHTRVEASLNDLWLFLNQPTQLPLAHIAVAHGQFENIHPFVDGNGRVGRALVHSYLRRSDLSRRVTVPISAGLLANPQGYVTALTSLRQGDPAPIVQQFVQAARDAASIGREMVGELQAVRRQWQTRVTARSDSVAWAIADGLIAHPAVTGNKAAELYGVDPRTARTAIASLVNAGVLRRASSGSRNQVWVAEEVTATYDRIAVLIGRRKPY